MLEIFNILKKYLFEIDIVDPWVDKDAVKERYGIIISDKVIDNKKSLLGIGFLNKEHTYINPKLVLNAR